MTLATVRAAAEHLARVGSITPHQLAALGRLDERLKEHPDILQEFTEGWRAQGSPAAPVPAPAAAWLPSARRIIKEFEGLRLQAYPDAGAWAIGWGSTTIGGKVVREGQSITQAQADAQLDADLVRFYDALVRAIPAVASWQPNRVAALLSWTYNVGVGAMQDSTLRRRILAGEDPAVVVAAEFPRWNKSGGTPLAGLTRRRNAEVALFVGQQLQQQGTTTPAGMVGPKKAPPLKPGDHHLIADDRAESLTAWTHDGKRLWSIPCLCRGQGRESEWNTTGSDTPPGLYLVGKVYRDYEQNPSATFSADRRAYGWYSLDLIGQEGQEGPGSKYGRDGIMMHGGGSACGWPGAWAPRQPLHPTLGCIRLHNVDLRDRVLPLLALGRIWVSVLQEAA
jgi:GH24 family phage-related lysozyme (muramidase)